MTIIYAHKMILVMLVCCFSACAPVHLDYFRLEIDDRYRSHRFSNTGLTPLFEIKVKDGVVARVRLSPLNEDEIDFQLTLLIPQDSTLRLITDSVVVNSMEGSSTLEIRRISVFEEGDEIYLTKDDLLVGSTHRIRTILIFVFNDFPKNFYFEFDKHTFKSKNTFTIDLPEMKVNEVVVKLPTLRFERHSGWELRSINR